MTQLQGISWYGSLSGLILALVLATAACDASEARGAASDAFYRPFYTNQSSNAQQLAAALAADSQSYTSNVSRPLGCECLQEWNYTATPGGVLPEPSALPPEPSA